ncbi:hypothetical protein BH10ACI2_BH10ACI2_17250 [soil metagenome]
MKTLVLGLLITLLTVGGLIAITHHSTGVTAVNAAEPEPKPNKSLKAFGSEKELSDFLAGFRKKAISRSGALSVANAPNKSAAAEPMSAAKDQDKTADSKEESITNNQHAGVDEGGIVKLHGDYLVVLRRGRLFTVAVGDDRLKPVSYADAFGGQIDPDGTWYDEMLVSGNTIAVIGYSYSRGGTEVGLFMIDDAGKLTYGSTYHLRSNDYYSSRNYASRMIGGKLVFYAPHYLSYYGGEMANEFPAVRKWHKGAKDAEFQRIIPANRIYNGMRDTDFSGQLALHTVMACDIDGGTM